MKLREILEAFKQPLPPSAISTKSIKGQKIPFVSWYDLADLLDARAGLGCWEWHVVEMTQVGNNLHCIGSLTIRGDDGNLTMQATGCESTEVAGYGDPSSNAEAMAMRRAAAKFGLGRELWRKDSQKSQSQSRKGELTREQWLALKAN